MKPTDNPNPTDFRIKLPFAIGEEVWFLCDTGSIIKKKVEEYKITHNKNETVIRVRIDKPKSLLNVIFGDLSYMDPKDLFKSPDDLFNNLKEEFARREKEEQVPVKTKKIKKV